MRGGLKRAVTPCLAALVGCAIAGNADRALAAGATPEPVHVGRAKIVVRDVRSQTKTAAARMIAVNETLSFEERIITTADSNSVVEFRDGSLLQVGPNSVIVLDRFVFNPFESKSEKVITAVSGAFRYISGMKTKTSSLQIRAGSATIGIRGSEAVFMVHPSMPTFFSLGDGVATVNNGRNSVSLQPGQSIAYRGNDRPLPQPQQIPPPVAAQVLQHISALVGPPPAPGALPALTPAEARADAAANAVPAAAQAGQQQAVLPGGPGPASPPGLPAPTGVGLLIQAAQVGLLDNAPGAALTPAQTSFVARANAAVPNAAAIVQASRVSAGQQTGSNGDRSTRVIVTDAAKFSADSAAVEKIVEAAAGADADRAVLVTQSALAGAPGNALLIAAAGTRGAPGAAAGIAGSLARAQPQLAAAIAVVVTNINKGAASDIAVAVVSAVPPDQAAGVVTAVANVVPDQSANLVASVVAAVPTAADQVLAGVATAAGSGDQQGGTTPNNGVSGNGNGAGNENTPAPPVVGTTS